MHLLNLPNVRFALHNPSCDCRTHAKDESRNVAQRQAESLIQIFTRWMNASQPINRI